MRSSLTLDCTNNEEALRNLKERFDNLKDNKYHGRYRLYLYSNSRLKFKFAMQYRGMVNRLYSMNKQVHGQAVLSSVT